MMHYSCLQIPPKLRTGFNMYAEYNSRPQLTFLALHPWEGTNIKKQYFNYAEGGT